MFSNPHKNIQVIAKILKRKYGNDYHHNRKNPLEELFFILLSVRSTEKVYLKIFKALHKKYPGFKDIHKAPVREIRRIIQPGGKQYNKSRAIKNISTKIIKRFGRLTLAPLKKMSDKECEKYLISLPGIGKKIARCVMLYSLNRVVFPVDSHCWRICKRLGWIKHFGKSKSPPPITMDKLQEIIPVNLRYSLHVNMISFGRDICIPLNPKCSKCPIKYYCISKDSTIQGNLDNNRDIMSR